jgi:hypothetical protein
MKVNAKSNVTQILKYALLGLAVELKRQSSRQHSLLILGKGAFAGLWKEKPSTPLKLLTSIQAADLSPFLSKQHVQFRSCQEQFAHVIRTLQLSWLSYTDLAGFLRSECPEDHNKTSGAEVYRKVISGMLNELQLRGLST